MDLHIGDHARTDLASGEDCGAHGESEHVRRNHIRTSPPSNLNIMDWITAPRKFTKGMNVEAHIKKVKRFIEQLNAPMNFHIAILTNSLDEESQLELFSRPEFDDTEEDIGKIIDIMKKTFEESKTEISNLVTLLEEKQESNENVTKFLARLRIKAYKLMQFPDKEEKEECILNAFVNGLKDKKIAKAVELMKPSDTETALYVAKREESLQGKKSDISCFNFAKEQDNANSSMILIREMSQQIALLTQQVTFLTNLIQRKQPTTNFERNNHQHGIKAENRTTYADVAKGNSPVRSRPRPMYGNNRENMNTFRRGQNTGQAFRIQCWNCQGTGHSWRNCSRRIACRRCLSTGHITRFCRQGEAVRYLEVEGDIEENDNVTDEEISVTSEETVMETNDCLTMEEEEKPEKITAWKTATRREKSKRPKCRNENEESSQRNINDWVNYVNGKTNKKPSLPYQPTVISESRSETAANKPLIRGQCENKNVPILIDSGAALNVIDESFVKAFGSRVKIRPESVTIRCANNGKVASLGKVFLKTKIGSHEEYMKFTIIPNLFPKVIVGLRQMKHSDIVIDAKADCIWMKNEKVSFMSKTKGLVTGNQ